MTVRELVRRVSGEDHRVQGVESLDDLPGGFDPDREVLCLVLSTSEGVLRLFLESKVAKR